MARSDWFRGRNADGPWSWRQIGGLFLGPAVGMALALGVIELTEGNDSCERDTTTYSGEVDPGGPGSAGEALAQFLDGNQSPALAERTPGDFRLVESEDRLAVYQTPDELALVVIEQESDGWGVTEATTGICR